MDNSEQRIDVGEEGGDCRCGLTSRGHEREEGGEGFAGWTGVEDVGFGEVRERWDRCTFVEGVELFEKGERNGLSAASQPNTGSSVVPTSCNNADKSTLVKVAAAVEGSSNNLLSSSDSFGAD